MEDALLLVDRTSIHMQSVLSRNKRQFDRDYKRPATRIRKRFLEDVPSAPSGREAIELIEAYLAQVEAALAAIVGTHSSYFWLHLLRRIMPVSVDGYDNWSTNLARVIAELAILKHGASMGPDMSQEFETQDGYYFPKDAGYFDYIAAYQIEYLAFEFWHLTAVARTIWKGGSLVVEGSDYRCNVDEELRRLIRSVDSRVPQQPLLAQVAGLERIEMFSPDDAADRSTVLLFAHNSSRRSIPLPGETEPFPANYIPYVVSIEAVGAAFRPYDQVMADAGLPDSHELAVFLEAAWLRSSNIWFQGYETAQERRLEQYQLVQRAYWVSGLPADELATDLAETHAMVHPDSDVGENSETIGRCLSFFTYDPESTASIDLWNRAPMRFIWRLDGGQTLIDLAKIPSALDGLAQVLGSASGGTGTIKGYALEKQVSQAMSSMDRVALWQCQKVLTDSVGTKREIDVSFVAGDTLVIVECKALVRSDLMDRGEIVTLRRRWKELCGYLDDAHSKATLIAECPDGRNYGLPTEVTRVAWILCTSNAEYIHSVEDRFWLTDGVPRICTCSELTTLVESGYDWAKVPESIDIKRDS